MASSGLTVLGIHDGHDAGAALIRDGRVLAAVQEERLRNIKHYSGVPTLAIREVFRIAGVDPGDVGLIAMAGLVRVHAPLRERPLYVSLFEFLSPVIASGTFAKLYVNILHRFRKMTEVKAILDELGLSDRRITFVEHHTAHAACAYRSCSWGYEEPVLVLTADGSGDGLSSTVSVGNNGRMERVAETIYYHSLGNVLYSEITRYLGMTPWDHEYKVMGLAPYGRADLCLDRVKKIIRVDERDPLRFRNTIGGYTQGMQPKLRKLLAGQRFDNIAAATQQWFEQLMVQWVKNAVAATGVHKLACGGGLFLNVKANKAILALEEVEDAFFYPAAGDDGIAVGAALESYAAECQQRGLALQKVPIEGVYYGPSYSPQQIEDALRESGWYRQAKPMENAEDAVADLLASGRIVARFAGGMEWGPRSLGNRSILAKATDTRVVHRINSAIKQRDFWMPFAPSVLEEAMPQYVKRPRPAPYMILAFDTTEKRDDLLAALHPYDFTARPQSVSAAHNPTYHALLKSFQGRTGLGGLLNTSFNLHGYPIVCTPQQALWTFERSDLDALALGPFLVTRDGRGPSKG
ncbi:MAG: hypothetical protein HY683_05205 [Chloroflexi bacterium]|nr:hypothetical protein [Chloroflexota bacterium]